MLNEPIIRALKAELGKLEKKHKELREVVFGSFAVLAIKHRREAVKLAQQRAELVTERSSVPNRQLPVRDENGPQDEGVPSSVLDKAIDTHIAEASRYRKLYNKQRRLGTKGIEMVVKLEMEISEIKNRLYWEERRYTTQKEANNG